MTKKNIQCTLVGLGRMTALRAQGWREFDSISSSGCRGLWEDDDVMGPGRAWVISIMGLRTVRAAQHHGLREDIVVAGSGTTMRAWGRRLCGRRHH
jgi:hypothetical protein